MSNRTVVAVDTLGGDAGPAPVVAGVARISRQLPEVRFILVGDEAELARLLRRRRAVARRCTLRHAPDAVAMTEKPGAAFRRRENTSMWNTIGCVAGGEAQVAMSCGNTGALAVMAMAGLKTLPGATRPAIAALWPTRTRGRLAVMLDMGAHYSATSEELRDFGIMGALYARVVLGSDRPRIALLNIGTEHLKGHPEVREAANLLGALAEQPGSQFEYVGFVEGNDITGNSADVIVTDGFTGNVALKTAEGIARLVREVIYATMRKNLLSRLAGALAYPSFRGLRNWMDPRRLNGGVLLGLNGIVVKSHGRADAKGVEAALRVAIRVAEQDLRTAMSRELEHFAQEGPAPAEPP